MGVPRRGLLRAELGCLHGHLGAGFMAPRLAGVNSPELRRLRRCQQIVDILLESLPEMASMHFSIYFTFHPLPPNPTHCSLPPQPTHNPPT